MSSVSEESVIGAKSSNHDNPYYPRDSRKLLMILKVFMSLPKVEQRKTMFWQLLRKFIGNADLLFDTFDKCENDIHVYSILHKLYHERGIELPTLASSGDFRAEQRSNEICKILEKFDISIEGGRYLDYGCSTGTITAAIGRRLGADTHGCDVPHWHGVENKCTDKFITYQHLQNGKIPESKIYSNFDLVTAFMVLHHIQSDCLNSTLHGIIASIKDNGYLLLREHDVVAPETYNYCHFEHAMYDLVVPETPFKEFYDEYVAHYHSMDYWETLITSMGMELIYTTKPWGVTRYAYMLFKKSKKIEPVASRGTDQKDSTNSTHL
jgi:SAM-dependent methyltransferase